MHRWMAMSVLGVVCCLGAMGCGDDTATPGDAGTMGDATPPIGDGAMSDGGGLPTAPPSTLTMVSGGSASGFNSPTDAVASPDGTTFYFAAFTDTGDAAIYQVASSAGATPTAVVTGAPLEYPSGLVLSCDGSTLYVADTGSGGADGSGDSGALYALDVGSGTLSQVMATGLDSPNALAFDKDCTQLYVAGRDSDGQPAVLTVPPSGGAATTFFAGDPLVDPTGLHVDAMGVVWLLDHLAEGTDGPGVLFRIDPGMTPTIVMGGLKLGTPGGVSLTAGGGNAVISTRDASGQGQLTEVNLATMTITQLAAPPALLDPAGLRTARAAGVFAVVDSEGGAIYRAE